MKKKKISRMPGRLLQFLMAAVILCCTVLSGCWNTAGPSDPLSSAPAESSEPGNSSSIADMQTPGSALAVKVPPAAEGTRDPVIVTEIVEKGGKRYIERLGTPYLQYGVQITTGRTENETESFEEEFYQKAKEIGFNTVLKAVKWNDIEPEEDQYDLYTVERIIQYAEKYDLLIELLWFGGNVGSRTTYAPYYVNNNTERFPKKQAGVFDFSNQELIERESKALTQVLNYLYDNDTDRRVSVIQIENEPASSNCYAAQLDAFLNYLDQMGRVVKNSCYRTVTRVNLAIDNEYLHDDFQLMGQILALDGIDMVGPDVYSRDLEYFIQFAERFTSGDMQDNIMHFAEGPGQVYNYNKIVALSFAHNSGYYAYELKSYGGLNFDFGIFRNDPNDWVKRDGTRKVFYQWDMITKVAENVTDDIASFNRMVNAVSEQIASCPNDQFIAIFRDQREKIGDMEIAYTTTTDRVANRIGAAFLANDGCYYCFTPAETATFTFVGQRISGSASVGAFENGVWKESATAEITQGNALAVKAGNVYRLSAEQFQ